MPKKEGVILSFIEFKHINYSFDILLRRYWWQECSERQIVVLCSSNCGQSIFQKTEIVDDVFNLTEL